MKSPAETALVLSGGAAYGAFAVGVLKVLAAGRSPGTNYQPLNPGIVTGTSVGAFNASFFTGCEKENCMDAALALEKIWLERIAERPNSRNGIFRVVGDVSDSLDPNSLLSPAHTALTFARDGISISKYLLGRTADFLASNESFRLRLIGVTNLGSFVDTQPYNDLLRDVICEEDIFKSQRRLTIVATNWITGEAIRFHNSDFKNGLGISAIMASTAIPGIFPEVRIGTDTYVDGGTVENTPLTPALDLGATELHVVYLDPNPEYIPLLGAPNTLDTMLRVYQLMIVTKLNEDIETARWINDGLKALAAVKSPGSISKTQMRDLVRAAGILQSSNTQYKPITLHRYFPRANLGNELGLMDFSLDPLIKLIEEGERVALLHDCAENGCLLEST